MPRTAASLVRERSHQALEVEAQLRSPPYHHPPDALPLGRLARSQGGEQFLGGRACHLGGELVRPSHEDAPLEVVGPHAQARAMLYLLILFGIIARLEAERLEQSVLHGVAHRLARSLVTGIDAVSYPQHIEEV